MDIKKLLTGTIIGGVLFFLLGWLIYGNLLMNFMRNHTGKVGGVILRNPHMLYLVAGTLLQGAALAWITLKANVKSMAEGLTTGAVAGFLITASYDVTMYATTIVTSKQAIAADIIAATVIFAVVGAVIGFVYGNKKTA